MLFLLPQCVVGARFISLLVAQFLNVVVGARLTSPLLALYASLEILKFVKLPSPPFSGASVPTTSAICPLA